MNTKTWLKTKKRKIECHKLKSILKMKPERVIVGWKTINVIAKNNTFLSQQTRLNCQTGFLFNFVLT